MRALFRVRSGDRFNATEVGKGLESLKNLYASKGYANFGAIPKPIMDESAHVVSLTIVIDEGRAVSFGSLHLEGLEPIAGAGKSLLAAWKDMRGKMYNPQLLQQWLATNTSAWPKDAASQVNTEFVGDWDHNPFVFDVLLHFQQRDP